MFDMDKAMKGITPGIVAGLLFLAYTGVGMTMMIADMIGSSDAIIGFIIHLIISGVLGAAYTGSYTQVVPGGGLAQTLALGLVWGIIWWVVGANLIMPLIGGGDVFTLDFSSPSLYGHIIFGVMLAWLVAAHD